MWSNYSFVFYAARAVAIFSDIKISSRVSGSRNQGWFRKASNHPLCTVVFYQFIYPRKCQPWICVFELWIRWCCHRICDLLCLFSRGPQEVWKECSMHDIIQFNHQGNCAHLCGIICFERAKASSAQSCRMSIRNSFEDERWRWKTVSWNSCRLFTIETQV